MLPRQAVMKLIWLISEINRNLLEGERKLFTCKKKMIVRTPDCLIFAFNIYFFLSFEENEIKYRISFFFADMIYFFGVFSDNIGELGGFQHSCFVSKP